MSSDTTQTANARTLLESSNDPPHPAEVAIITEELRGLAERIAETRCLLQAFEEQERRLRAVLSPLRRVPCEVLGEIFSLCLDGVTKDEGNEAALGLCLVCRQWRDAARLSRELWKHLNIEYPAGATVSLEKVAAWFSRAGTLPKSLIIQPGRHNHESSPNEDLCLAGAHGLANIISCGPILDSLTLHLLHVDCYRNLEQSLALTTPSNSTWHTLRYFVLQIDDGWKRPPNFARIASASSFRLLLPPWQNTFSDEVQLASVVLTLPSTFLGNLTRLYFRVDWLWGHSVPILMQCTSLEDLTVDFTECGTAYHESDHQVLLAAVVNRCCFPKLRNLRLREVDVGFTLLRLLETPALTHLEFGFNTLDTTPMTEEHWALEIEQAWKPFVCRYGSSIRSLRIHDVELPRAAVPELFKEEYFPSLAELTLDCVRLQSSALFPYPSNKPLFRKLEVLHLLNMDPDFNMWSVYAFLGVPMTYLSNGQTIVTEGKPPPNMRKLLVTYRRLVLDEDEEHEECLTRTGLIEGGIDIDIGPVYRYKTDRVGGA